MNKVDQDYMAIRIPHDTTIAQAHKMMRVMKLAREKRTFKGIVALFDGFSSSSRDLWDIPEARELAKMLNSMGFGSYLEPATFHSQHDDIRLTLGLYELWLIETGKNKRSKEHWLPGGVVEMLIRDANDKSDEALGEFINPPKQKWQAKPSAN